NIHLKQGSYYVSWKHPTNLCRTRMHTLVTRLSIIGMLIAGCFILQNGGACRESLPNVITNLHGQVLFISENATDVGEALQDAVSAGVNLRNAKLNGIQLRDVRLSGADLRGADFSGSLLEDVDFSNADLSHANFKGAKIKRVHYRDAILQGAKLAL